MRRILILLLLCTPFQISAQKDKIVDIFKAMGPCTIEFTVGGSAGVADIWYPHYRIVTSESRIYGDGRTMWIYYPEASEVIISNSLLEGLLGEAVLGRDSGGHQTVTLESDASDPLVLTVTSQEKSPVKWDEKHFLLDVSSLGDDVIVTDMR